MKSIRDYRNEYRAAKKRSRRATKVYFGDDSPAHQALVRETQGMALARLKALEKACSERGLRMFPNALGPVWAVTGVDKCKGIITMTVFR